MEKMDMTASAMVKNLILEAVEQDDSQAMTRKELVEFVNAHMDHAPSDGVLAGAFKMLVTSGELISEKRGFYKRGASKGEGFAYSKIYQLCTKFKAELKKSCTFNMLDMTAKERAFCIEFMEVLDQGTSSIDSFMEKLQGLMEGGSQEKSETMAFQQEGQP